MSNQLDFKVKKFSALSAQEVYDILQLREEVFIIEQTCIYQDIDGTDTSTYHLMGYKNNVLVAYARLIQPGIKYDNCSIGRVAVKKSERLNNYGKVLMTEAISFLSNEFPAKGITISAQLYLKNFYESFDFVAQGEVYPEDDIPHIKMARKKLAVEGL